MYIQKRIKRIENRLRESGGGCDCPKIVSVGSGEKIKLCPKCLDSAETVLIFPSLTDVPKEIIERHKGKVYAGFDADLV